MGWYVSIVSKKNPHKVLLERKYGLGFPILMFTDYDRTRDGVVFEADGKTAKDNICKVIEYLEANKNPENLQAVEKIEKEMADVYHRLSDDETYISDYTESLGVVDNPNFDPLYFIEEMRERMEDAVNGYSEYGHYDSASEQLLAFIDSLSDEIKARVVYKNSRDFVIIGAGVVLTDADRNAVTRGSVTLDNNEYEVRYAERKLFYILKKSGIRCNICRKSDKYFYILISRSEVDKWLSTKPYVNCSYRYDTTYDIPYAVRNTPEEKEKFYCFAKWKDGVVSIVIDGVEVVNATDREVSDVIGKELRRACYESDEINMKYIG